MKEKQKNHKEKPLVEPQLIKGQKLDEVTFQPAGYGDPATTHHSFSPFPHLSFLSHHHHRRR